MSRREHAHQLVDLLPDSQVAALVGLLESMIDPLSAALRNAPMDDEPETAGERQAVAEAHGWLSRHGGKAVPHDEAMRRLGLK